MELFLYYLLRATIVTALFYGFYKLLFSKVTFYAINRLSLLGVLLIVIALPMFRFNLLPEPKEMEIITVPIETTLWDLSQLPVTEVVSTQSLQIPWMLILIALYAVGGLFFAGRYFIGMFQLNAIIRKSEKQSLADGATLCITDTNIAPFSWFKYIVLSRNDHSAENRAILHHERAHIRLSLCGQAFCRYFHGCVLVQSVCVAVAARTTIGTRVSSRRSSYYVWH